MIRLPESLHAWNTPAFAAALKRELEAQARELPLQGAVATTSMALDDAVSVMFIGAADEGDAIRARVGVFFSGIVAGCSCADDPTPVEPQNEYCELLLLIDKATGEVAASLAEPDSGPA